MTDDEFNPHDLDEEAFFDEVHSFEFWFQTVEGYLNERPYGVPPDLADVAMSAEAMSAEDRDTLVTILCNYCVGEAAALEAASGMVRLAPNHHLRSFMATQVADEARHLEVFLHRLRDLGVADPHAEIERRATPNLKTFKRRLLELVDDRDWDASVLAQNVILETMEFSVFALHADNADPVTAEVLKGVISDERRHLGFGENEMGRRLAHDPTDRPRLAEVRQELDTLVLDVFDETFAAIGAPEEDRTRIAREYTHAIARLGLDL